MDIAFRDMPRARASVRTLGASRIRELANAAMGRPGLLSFWFGESDEPTPRAVVEGGIAALAQGLTFYTHNLGIPGLRGALADYAGKLHGRTIAEHSIAVTSSGVSALMVAMQAILGPGDQVVAVTPVWPNVTEIPRLLGARVVRIPLHVRSGRWRLDLDALLDAITPVTRLVLLNSPGNPTGWTIEPEQRAAVLNHCRRLGVWLLSDDVYERLTFSEGGCAPSFLALAEPEDRLISANSFSKTWSMTGWRLGWITAPPGLIQDLVKLLEYNTSCAPEFVQRAGMAALAMGDAPVEDLRRSLLARRNDVLAALDRIDRAEAAQPDGGMYIMLRIRGFPDSAKLARRLVEEANLGLAPGSAFGPEGEGWLRWCIAARPDKLAEGMARLETWLACEA